MQHSSHHALGLATLRTPPVGSSFTFEDPSSPSSPRNLSRSASPVNTPILVHSPTPSKDFRIYSAPGSPTRQPVRIPSIGPGAWIVVPVWIVLSSAVILYNREIMRGNAHFEYPITLTALHLAFQTFATRILHQYTDLIAFTSSDPHSYATLPTSEEISKESKEEEAKRLKDASVAMDWDTWKKTILPPAILFSVSLVLSNWAYIYLSTAYIHILKAFSPVAILLAAFIFRTRPFRTDSVLIVLLISIGVGLGSYGEAEFNVIGFTMQAVAIAVEATRVTLIQILLQGGSMGPLKSLYFFAPVCLFINAAMILPVEGFAALRAIPGLGIFTILSNCTLTFLLNLSAVYLIGISSMVLSLSKVGKDVLMVGGSAFLLGDKLTWVQVGGYVLATIGLLWYKTVPH